MRWVKIVGSRQHHLESSESMSLAAPDTHHARLFRRLVRMVSGGTASIAATVIASNMLRIISSMTLTRLLDSTAFGVVGIITSVSYMLAMISDVGLAPFVVRHEQGDDAVFLDQIWTIRLIRGAALTATMVLFSRPAAYFLGKPELAPVIAVWSLNFLIDGLSSMATVVGIRQKKLWRLGFLDLGTNVATVLTSILIALIWKSFWALIIAMLVGAIMKAVMSYIIFPQSRRSLIFDAARSRELWMFSRYIAISSILSLFVLQADKVVLARMMPLAAYGLYAIATTLSVAPDAIIGGYMVRVLFPIYAEAARRNRAALRTTFYAARRRFALFYMFAVGGLIGSAPLVVAILYDHRYRAVAPFLQLLAIRVLLRMPALASQEVLVALGHTRSTLAANIARLLWLIGGGILGILSGNVMILVAAVGTDEVAALACLWFNIHREGLLVAREEIYGGLAGLLGIGLGLAVTNLMLPVFQ